MKLAKKTKTSLVMLLSAAAVLGITSCGGGSVNYLKEVINKGYEDTDHYTYNTYSSLSPASWNDHNWQTTTDSIIQGYAEMGLYGFGLNDAKDGWTVNPEMAASDPVAVQLTGAEATAANTQYGASTETVKGTVQTVANTVYDIELNPNAVWADGKQTPINADTYLYSAQQLLNPSMQNYRANTLYSGSNNFSIANAQDYFKQGQEAAATLTSIMATLGIKAADYADPSTADALFALSAGKFASSSTDGTIGGLKAYCNYNYSFGTGEDKVVDTELSVKEFWSDPTNGYYALCNVGRTVTALQAWAWYVGGEGYGYVAYPAMTADHIGLAKVSDYKIRLYLANPISLFYVKYNLSSNFIVYKDLYEGGKTIPSDPKKLTTTNYGTSVDTYMSYGPYKLTSFETDKQFTLDRNDDWYGYKDAKHTGKYQTDTVKFTIIKDQNAALESFLSGSIDDIGLDANQIKDYGYSKRLLQAPESYTQKLTFNTDKDTLLARTGKGTNKTIVLEKDFREAFSLAMDRETYCASYTAGFTPSTVLLNQLYYTDFEAGIIYRNTDAGKSVSPAIYGDVKNGYDLGKAKTLFESAYTAAVADGNYVKGTPIVLQLLLSSTSSTALNARIQFIRDCVTAATKGTDLEGMVSITTKLDEDYYNTAYKGAFDLIFTNWGGMTADPFGFMEVYTHNDGKTMCEYGFHPETEKVTFKVEGADVVKTYYDWYVALSSGDYSASKASSLSVREDILAQLEIAIIKLYDTVCLAGYASASLSSYKIQNATETYVDLVGFGGIDDIHYRFNDTTWSEALNKQAPNYK